MLNKNCYKIKSNNFTFMHNNLKSVVHSHNFINNSNKKMTAKGDSGATSHYLRKDHKIFFKKFTGQITDLR